MKKLRLWMKIDTRISPANDHTSCVPAQLSHAGDLGHLMHRAYKGTIDDENETLEQCIQEMRDTLAGKYGPLIDAASFVTFSDGRIVSASIITFWKDEPLLAYSMTDPDYQRRGLAGSLIEKSIEALRATSMPHLFLVVTEGNPAQKLYARLGFEVLGSALPQQPPPPS